MNETVNTNKETKAMKLKSIGSNQTELIVNKPGETDVVVLFSYSTPVAAHVQGEGFYITQKKWSRTTSKHITQWLQRHGDLDTHPGEPTRPQEFFDELVS